MNVLYLDATRSLYGASRALLTLLENVDRHNIHPYVVLANDVEDDLRLCAALRRLRIPYKEYKLAVLRRQKYLNPRGIFFMGRSLLGSVPFLARAIRRYKINLVHTNTSTVLSGAVAAAICGVPHVWHVHEIFRKWEGEVLTRMLGTLSSRVVVPSEATANNLRGFYPRLSRKLKVITNGVDPTPFRSVSESDVERVRREWSIRPGEQVVGMVGRIGMWKGEEQFVEMARLVSQQRDNVKFVIVGGTFDNQERHVDDLRAVISSQGLSERVLLAGLRDDVPAVLNSFDVLAHLPVRPEPFGLVAIEAMSAGKSVVAAAMGGLTEIVRDGETGFLVGQGQIESAAARVLALLDDAALRERMGHAGSRRVDAEFSSAAYATRFQALYRSIIE
ncbi:MAG TPA: glycosyltransferase family 4 protein [Chloroflexia bacterium]